MISCQSLCCLQDVYSLCASECVFLKADEGDRSVYINSVHKLRWRATRVCVREYFEWLFSPQWSDYQHDWGGAPFLLVCFITAKITGACECVTECVRAFVNQRSCREGCLNNFMNKNLIECEKLPLIAYLLWHIIIQMSTLNIHCAH